MDIDSAWKSTCKILLGEEIGELREYAGYLSDQLDLSLSEKESSLSGKKAFVSSSNICPGARFIGGWETKEYLEFMKREKLDINQIKDIDSILSALSEKLYYGGSITLGRAREVDESDKCTDSSFVHHSQMIYENSKFIAFSNMARSNEYCFGVTVPGESRFLIRSCLCWRSARCFETLRTFNSSDCYYVANVEGSVNCMFSFNQRNVSNCIGNLALPKDKYAALKQKLVEDIRETLRERKGVPHILDLIADCGGRKAKPVNLEVETLPASFSAVENAFGATTAIVLGKRLGPLVAYGRYLSRHVGEISAVESAESGTPVMIAPVSFCTAVKDNVMPLEESVKFGKNHLEAEEVEGLALSNASRKLVRIKTAAIDADLGTNVNMIQCAVSGNDSSNSFRGFLVFKAKNTAYVRWPRGSENVFGASNLVSSGFCIKCYNSVNLSRCFEVDGSNGCSDCYFCHNCEGLSECMFCFNAKSLRYAIGNVEVDRERYMEIKKRVLGEIVGKLEKDEDLAIDIYNIGCYMKKKPINKRPGLGGSLPQRAPGA